MGRKRKKRKGPKAKLKRQLQRAHSLATYGKTGKPAPVTVRSLETGEVVGVHRQAVLTKRFADQDKREKEDWISERFAHLGFKSYGGYLRSTHWRDVKMRWVEAGRSVRCFVCGKNECQLHHRTYERLGCEKLDDLVPLCQRHHRAVHRMVSAHHWPLFTAHLKLAEREAEADRRIEDAFDEAA